MKLLLAHPLRNRYFLVSDLLFLPLAGYLSYVLRLEAFDWAIYGAGFLLLVGLACVIVPLVFRWAGVYARYWRYASVDELLLLAGSVTVAVLLAGAISLAVVQLLPARPPLPRSIPLPKHRGILSSFCSWPWSPRPARASPCGCPRVRWPASVPTAGKRIIRPNRS